MDYRTKQRKKEEIEYIRIGECSNCGRCCRGIFPSKSSGLKIDVLRNIFDKLLNKNGLCKFHSRRLKRCMIYPYRPDYCIDYPAVPSDLIPGCTYSFKKNHKLLKEKNK